MKGGSSNPLQINLKDVMTGFIGGFLTIYMLILVTNLTMISWLMAPFGASCVLAFSAWNAPLSQPRNIIGGHFVSSFVGLSVATLIGTEPWSVGMAVGLAISCMMLTKTTHPPAGADPIVIMLGSYNWSYLFSPVLTGSVLIVIMALLINNLRQNRRYPIFWY
ncbi:HPP family protein [Metabacillus malikii]|uniref:HPP family protein n=1 Tax=Metabacillus malikii TaxID=1504265 RepID=UPI0027D86611|nr:HPP family protein [Metabacillus malikii]